jgi:hypothetical protein
MDNETKYPNPTITPEGGSQPDLRVQGWLDEWDRGKTFVDNAIKDFQALDTVTNAQYTGGNKKNPNIGDTTIAGMVREMMRTAVKVIPNTSIAINGSKTTLQAIIVNNQVKKVIMNPITFGKGFINTLHLGGRGALSRGFNVFQVSATSMYGKFGVTPKLIHFNDFAIEPGVQDGSHSTFFYIRTKWTPGKLNQIIAREEKKPAGQSTYDVEALKVLRAQGADSSGASDYAQYLTPDQQGKADITIETYDILTRYSNDANQPIVMLSPYINRPLRTVENRSKFGYPRTLFLVIDPAELSPFGDSRVRLASPNQNFLMALRQNVATTWLYNSKPTMVKSGLFTGATNLKAGGVITSTDPNAKVTLLTLDTATAQQYPTISEGIVKQIQAMMGMNPGQSLGAIGDSKTGIGAQKQAQGIDNSIQQITNIIEEFLCQYIVSAIDLYLSEQDGESTIYVDDSTRDTIQQSYPTDQNGQPTFADPTNPNALVVNWNQLYEYIEEIDVTVNSTMSKEDYTDEKRGDLQDAATVAAQTANTPEAAAKAEVLQDKFIKETAPELAPAIDAAGANAPQPQADLTQMQ